MAVEARAVTALAAILREMILSDGPMTVARYMALCLGHPQHGYYITRDPLGRGGDFTTAPEISQMFGELLGLWVADTWQRMGAPGVFGLVELGPGRGTLMADALRAARALPGFTAAVEVHLVETSPVLRQAQGRALAGARKTVEWHETIDTLPGDRPLIVLANEFFDALPIRQFVQAGGVWRERLVGLDAAGTLVFGLSGEAAEVALPEAPEGALREACPDGVAIITALGARLAAQGGALLAIDYGYAVSAAGDSLQALRAHRFDDVLAAPGEADLTAHVDFAALAAAGRRAGLSAHPLLSQHTLLARLGIGVRAGALMRAAPAQAGEIEAAGRRLTGLEKGGMGGLFKALCLTAPGLAAPAAFDSPDPVIASLTA